MMPDTRVSNFTFISGHDVMNGLYWGSSTVRASVAIGSLTLRATACLLAKGIHLTEGGYGGTTCPTPVEYNF